MIDLKENNLPGNFRGELFMDLEQHKFQVPDPINVKEYIDSQIKEQVAKGVEKLSAIVNEQLLKLVEVVHQDLIQLFSKDLSEKIPVAVEAVVKAMVTVQNAPEGK